MQMRSRHELETMTNIGVASEVHQLLNAIFRTISLETIELPNEFFPPHLSAALIEAFFASRLRDGDLTTSSAMRYCRHFGVACVRGRGRGPRPADERETLGDLVGHYDELGVDRMAKEVFQTRHRSTEATVTRAGIVLRAARALRRIGIDDLHDIPARRPEEIDGALRRLPGVGEGTARMFLMYTGDDDFVRGDVRVRKFVARALFRSKVTAARAEELVRQCAYELILSPRFLDREIWRFGTA